MSTLLPLELLIELLPATFEPWGSVGWYPSGPPTSASLERIRSSLGIEVPEVFTRAAVACSSYGGWFSSLGEDYDSHNHILTINQAFRREGLPMRYIMFNHGHDGDIDAWDTAESGEDREFPIVDIRMSEDGRIIQARQTHRTFRAYIDELCRNVAPRCPVKSLRRRAKRLLAAHAK